MFWRVCARGMMTVTAVEGLDSKKGFDTALAAAVANDTGLPFVTAPSSFDTMHWCVPMLVGTVIVL